MEKIKKEFLVDKDGKLTIFGTFTLIYVFITVFTKVISEIAVLEDNSNEK